MTLRRLVLCLVLAAAVALAADPGLTALLMSKPMVVAGINVDQAKNSPFGQKLLATIKDDDPGLQQLLSATGFDPRRDVREVIVASLAGSNSPDGLVAVRGIFNASQISAFVQAQGARTSSYKGVPIYYSPNSTGTSAFAFLDSSIAVLGGEANVKAAIDQRQSGSGGLNPDLAAKVADWSTRYDAWVISNGSLAGFGPFPKQGAGPGGFNLDSIKAATAGVHFGKTVEIAAEATMRSPEDASSLADVITFFASMAHGNKNQPPQQVLNLLDSMQVTPSGNLVKINLSMPESDLESLMGNAHGTMNGAPNRANPAGKGVK